MKDLLTSLCAVLMTTAAGAQCTVPIPPGTTVLTTMASAAITENNGYFWVCADVDLALEGNNNVVFVEPGVSGSVPGNNNTIISKGGNYFLIGNNNILYTQEPGTVVETGENNIVNDCPIVTFDLSGAPANGCQVITSVGTNGLGAIGIHPNPVRDRLFITPAEGQVIEQLRISDASGRVVHEVEGPVDGSIGMGGLTTGPYLLHMVTNTGTLVRTLVKE